MDSQSNTIAGWVLGAGIVALGGGIVGHMLYDGHRPTKMGYAIEGVEADAGGDAAAPEVPIATLLPKADAAKGAEVFKQCASCHNVAQGGANGIGPNLYAVVGDGVGVGRGGYAFSETLAKVGGKWDFDKLNAWLTSPRKFAPGTKMTFAGLGNPQDRANVLVYLNSQGSNVPLPAAPVAAAAKDPKVGGAAPGGAGAAAGAKTAVSAVASDTRAATADIANTGTPARGAPSLDPEATRHAAKMQ